MIYIRKAARIATMTACFLALASHALNQVHGQLASIMVLIGLGSIFHVWATVWPSPGPSLEELRIDRIAKRILRG